MKKKKTNSGIYTALAILVIVGVLPKGSIAEEISSGERASIESVVGRLMEAWRSGDGTAWANEFVEDADFTVWFGMSLEGAEQIAWGHQLIFDSFYADTVFELSIRKLRFIGDDVAIAHLSGFVIGEGEAPPEEPDAVPVAVFQKIGNDWKIVAFQNTPFAVTEFRMNGDLKRFKRLAAEQNDAQ